MRWFTSDLHLGHKNIIDYCKRPFRKPDGQMDTDAMFAQFLRNFQECVRPGDELFILGDIGFNEADVMDFLNRVAGQKFMIWGNHDPKKGSDRAKLAKLFVTTRDILETTLKDGTKAVMCHYPMLRWNKGHFGSYMLHGHTHAELEYPFPDDWRILDVGVDNTVEGHRKYYPWSEDEIIKYMTPRQAFKHHYHPSARE